MSFLKKLYAGDRDAWEEAFRCLYPVAFAAASSCTGGLSANDCEDIAMETLAALVEADQPVNQESQLKPWVASVARNKAADKFRKHMAAKRGSNKLESLDALEESEGLVAPGIAHEEFFHEITVNELRDLLGTLDHHLKKEHRLVLHDHYLENLSYAEIAAKRGIPIGSVGVFVQRALACLRSVIAQKPHLQHELYELLGETGVVRVLLPLISAIQIGGWFIIESRLFSEEASEPNSGKRFPFSGLMPSSLPKDEDTENLIKENQSTVEQIPIAALPPSPPPTDEEILRRSAENLPNAVPLDVDKKARLLSLAEKKYAAGFSLHRQRQNQYDRQPKAQERKSPAKFILIALLFFIALFLLTRC